MTVTGRNKPGAFALRFRIAALTAVAAIAVAPVMGSMAVAEHPAIAPAIPLYKDASQPVSVRVEDLLGRMTLDEKAAQLISIWQTKALIQTPQGDFDPAKASANFPNGLGMISRPSDRQGIAP